MYGTIGVAVRDRDGRFAVASSTGGTSLMLPGRIGDTPIFGAGVMCGPLGAVCATGDGEEILRRLASHRVYARIAGGEHPQIAVETEVSRFPEPWVVGFIAIGTNGYGSAATGDVMARAALEL
jgi:isoaspartyl peptidase/L-asparaginase-like protein (Ntn-hydrolase superfamily)